MSLEQAIQLNGRQTVQHQVSSKVPESAEEAINNAQGRINEAAIGRLRSIKDVALSVGIKAGMHSQIVNVENAISVYSRQLDTIYNFAPLMVQDRVVPPVISEARDLFNQKDDYSLRLSGAHYRIESQARFSSTSPVWRQYLSFSKPDLRALDRSLIQLRTDQDREIWRLGVIDGWRQGVDQANLILESAMDRMNRDYLGMLRFHTFVMQGKISMPAIASEQIAVSKDGATMTVDETLLRITTLSDFNMRSSDWRASIRTTSDPSPTQLVPIVDADQAQRRLPLETQN